MIKTAQQVRDSPQFWPELEEPTPNFVRESRFAKILLPGTLDDL
jgi:hypothetical protein